MALTWTAPAALWLLLAVPVIWIARPFSRTNFNPRQQSLQAALRSLVLVMIALALARPVISTGSSRLSVVYLVDVSHSVSSRAVDDAAKAIDDLNAGVRPTHSRIVAFGADAVVLDSTDALRRLMAAAAAPGAASVSPVDRTATDLEAALGAARAALAPGHVPRIVLFSDGRATAGDVRAAVTRLAAEGIPVHVEPLVARDLGDTWVDAIRLPDRLAAGSLFTATVAVGSQKAGEGRVELRSGGKVLASRTVPLGVGATDVALDVTLDQPGAQAVEAVVTMAGDPLAANDTLVQPAWIRPRAKVLYVEGAPDSAHYLAAALTASGFDVTVIKPAALPSRLEGFEPWDVVIVSDVPKAAIPDATMAALSEWVEKRGGGLLVAGGESVFGEGGYRRTELERLTPVTFERRDEPEVALIIVLDKSWSMAGQVMDLCKAAAQAAIDALGDEQSVGVVTFNEGLNWDVTLRNVGKNRAEIRKAVAAIEPGGHTLIFPAVEQAYEALLNAKARAKHVVLLSDGRSYPDDYEGLVKKMVAARMTVSSISVGPAADSELLANIAMWGKGRSYIVEDAKEVPQIFVKEAKNIPTPAFDEKTIRPVVKNRAFLEGVDLTRIPGLRGRTATVIKDTALELVATPDNDPLLAFWPIGLGRTAVFTSDVKDRWGVDWLRWRSYGPFFAAVVRALERQRPPAVSLEVVPGPIEGPSRSIALAVEARDATGNPRDLLRPVVHLRASDGTSADVPTHQVAPGRYEARVLADATRPLTLDLVGTDTGVTSRLVLPDPSEEYRFRPPDDALLKSIAAATGGAWVPTAAAIATATSDHRTARRPLWPALAIAALLLWFTDLLMRRVRVFEPQVEVEQT